MAKTFQIVIEKRGRVTNEDVIRAMFPNAKLVNCNDNTVGLRIPDEKWIIWFDEHWFYSPYEQKEGEHDRKG